MHMYGIYSKQFLIRNTGCVSGSQSKLGEIEIGEPEIQNHLHHIGIRGQLGPRESSLYKGSWESCPVV